MDNNLDFDWSHAGLFVAVADHGSLSAAARATGISQPTIGRAIHSLETNLGVSLFSRRPKGFELTEQGASLVFHARAMAEAAAQLSLEAAGRADQLDGVVRVTASQFVATHVLPSMLARLQRDEPRIQIEVVATDTVENLLFREADIAVRMTRPTQLELTTKHVGDINMGVYAAHAYLAQRPAPETLDDLVLHSLIGYDRSTLIIDGAREMGWALSRDHFSYRCDDQVVCWNMLLAGVGIGFAPNYVGASDDRLVRILHDVQLPVLPIWLTSHSALKTNRRVRYVYNFLGEAFSSAFN